MAAGAKTGLVAVAICPQDEAARILHELAGGNPKLYMYSENTNQGYYLVGTTGPTSAFWDQYHAMRRAQASEGRAPDAWWSQVYGAEIVSGEPQPDQGPRYYHVAAGPDAVRPILVALRQTADSRGWAVCGLAMAPMPDGTVWVGALGAEAVVGLRDSLEGLLGVDRMPSYTRTLPNGGHLKGTDPAVLQSQPSVAAASEPSPQPAARPSPGRYVGKLKLPPAAQRAADRFWAWRGRFGRR